MHHYTLNDNENNKIDLKYKPHLFGRKYHKDNYKCKGQAFRAGPLSASFEPKALTNHENTLV